MRPEAAHGFASGDCRGTSYGTAATTISTNARSYHWGIAGHPVRLPKGVWLSYNQMLWMLDPLKGATYPPS